jgi:magnesium transporter
MDHEPKLIYADDTKESIPLLLRLRLPWLIGGLILGTFTALMVSRYGGLLEEEVRLAYFMPLVVYISAAVGAQTQEVYVRNLAKGHARFGTYFFKELVQGIVLGTLFGTIIGTFISVFFKATDVAMAVGLSMLVTVSLSTLVGLLVPNILKKEHQDPAVGAAPVTNAVQDLLSLLIYLTIASLVLR